uniref:Uncharacterized protein n=1 Tax=Chromera velia CCMP2878 TaxID=1169474 RepID=A0A0G4I8A0_9ALVE|eukprot:Cvel_11805.t1-p1 / transcript=Cvel_11805.t1 / gene=Cvel_11805 / organism=Chromera_velia_CCMP2878 / gene_product=hypothetical protein / transcript_product=hypothetical protein / location=Cvel_scaffold751:27986-29420(-) / protein_length=104 / sequence_SO=supercontig / SO=protein_coding / is_pseudo=false
MCLPVFVWPLSLLLLLLLPRDPRAIDPEEALDDVRRNSSLTRDQVQKDLVLYVSLWLQPVVVGLPAVAGMVSVVGVEAVAGVVMVMRVGVQRDLDVEVGAKLQV